MFPFSLVALSNQAGAERLTERVGCLSPPVSPLQGFGPVIGPIASRTPSAARCCSVCDPPRQPPHSRLIHTGAVQYRRASEATLRAARRALVSARTLPGILHAYRPRRSAYEYDARLDERKSKEGL